MSRERRIRNELGDSVYYDEDECDFVIGAGIFDTMTSLASSAAAKLTGKTAKKITEKVVEKALEKGAEKVGEKTGQLIGEKIYDRFRGDSPQKQKGDQIIKELEKRPPPGESKTSKTSTDQRSKDQKLSLSKQFDELLKL